MNKDLFSKIFLSGFVLFSSFLIIETENYKYITSKTFIVLIVLNIIILTIYFFKSKRFLVYINLLVFFILIFFTNFFLFITSKSSPLKSEKFKYVNKNNYYPDVPPITNLKNNNGILPLSGLSNVKTVTANENGYWGMYVSDEYGFNNEKNQHIKIVNATNNKLIFLGDSMTQGSAVYQHENFVSLINENKDFTTLNLAYGGNGLLLSLAAYIEYGNHIKNSNIIFCFYEGNDFYEFEVEEKNNKKLLKYITGNYSQNLITFNDEKDAFVKNKISQQNKDIQSNTLKNKLDFYYNEIIKMNYLRKRVGLLNNKKEFYAYNDENFKKFEKILDVYKILASRNNSSFTFIYVPVREHFYSGNTYKGIYEKILIILKKKNINYIDLYQEMKKHKDPLSFFPEKVMRHFSAEGHSKLSKIIINNLN